MVLGLGGPSGFGEGPKFILRAWDYLFKGEYDKLKCNQLWHLDAQGRQGTPGI